MRFILALAFLGCSMQDASALQRANAQDYLDIQGQISKKKAAEDEIMTQNAELLKARGNEAAERKINLKISLLEKAQKNAAEQALWLTARAYDIIPFADNLPILDEGTSVLWSKEKGASITWLPVFEENGKKNLQDESGAPAGFRTVGSGIAGNTASDGISRVFPAAFSSPEMLASVIIHEQRHFIQNTTDGEGNKKTTAELEVEAYEEEWRLMEVLGFSGDSKRSQKRRLTEILDGKKGVKGQEDIIGKRKLAAEERAAAKKFNGGLPPPETSIVSHSKVEIDSLIQQAKDQIEIAQRDHDERLRNTLRTLTDRSCEDPGSVTQAELDALPKPHRREFLTEDALPLGQNMCDRIYFYLGKGGFDAETVKTMALTAALLQPPAVGPVALDPSRPKLFSSVFPDIKKFVIAACLDMTRVPAIYKRYGEYVISDNDENVARSLMAGQDDCSQQLFYKIIEKTHTNLGNFSLSTPWVKDVLNANTPKPVVPPVHADPPPPVGGRRCEDYGVINCPKSNEPMK